MMDVERHNDVAAAGIAAAIGEPARARMLYCLVDNRSRTSTELAVVAGVSPSTASVHLSRLKAERLVNVAVQGRHRYYSLNGAEVARVLEGLSVLAGGARAKFVPNTPNRLRAGRTCYDHIAGSLGVSLHDRLLALEWLTVDPAAGNSYDVTPKGARTLAAIGVDVDSTRQLRRHFAYGCLDWSERRSHIGGALGAAILNVALTRRWLIPDLDSRALDPTASGRREMTKHFGLTF